MDRKKNAFLEKWKNWDSSIPYWIYNSVALISGFCGILSFLVSIVVFFLQLVSSNFKIEVTSSFWNLVPIFAAITCFIVCIALISKYLKISKYHHDFKHDFAQSFYHFFMSFRNEYLDMSKIVHTKNNKPESFLEGSMKEKTYQLIRQGLDELCLEMGLYTGCKIQACVKLICPLNGNEVITKDNGKIYTFCRDKSSIESGRKEESINDGKPISGNTDFFDLLNPGNNKDAYFYQSDLISYAKDLEKLNKHYDSTTEHWGDYYNGTIVVPIRSQCNHLYYEDNDKQYRVLGFLCIDSLDKGAFRSDENSEYENTRLVKAFAATFFVALEKYAYFTNSIGSICK